MFLVHNLSVFNLMPMNFRTKTAQSMEMFQRKNPMFIKLNACEKHQQILFGQMNRCLSVCLAGWLAGWLATYLVRW